MSGEIVLLAPNDSLLESYREVAPEGAEITWVDAGLSQEELAVELKDAVAIIANSAFTLDTARLCPKLKLVQVTSAGTDRFDLLALGEMGIRVANNGGGNAPTVAEHTISLMIGVYRKMHLQYQAVRSGEWGGSIRADWYHQDGIRDGTVTGVQTCALPICSLDLSAFYFDIRKDTLYCDEVKSFKRKACINLLGLILDILLKWFAPILSFTTEEIFQILNREKNTSIHLEAFPDVPSKWENAKLFQKWNVLKKIRDVANAAIEVKRSNKDIGSSLEAEVQIYLSKEYLELVKDVDLPEYFITSKVEAKTTINDDKLFQLDEVDNVKVLVKKAKGNKCSRCWKILQNPCERNNCGLKN